MEVREKNAKLQLNISKLYLLGQKKNDLSLNNNMLTLDIGVKMVSIFCSII